MGAGFNAGTRSRAVFQRTMDFFRTRTDIRPGFPEVFSVTARARDRDWRLRLQFDSPRACPRLGCMAGTAVDRGFDRFCHSRREDTARDFFWHCVFLYRIAACFELDRTDEPADSRTASVSPIARHLSDRCNNL